MLRGIGATTLPGAKLRRILQNQCGLRGSGLEFKQHVRQLDLAYLMKALGIHGPRFAYRVIPFLLLLVRGLGGRVCAFWDFAR